MVPFENGGARRSGAGVAGVVHGGVGSDDGGGEVVSVASVGGTSGGAAAVRFAGDVESRDRGRGA